MNCENPFNECKVKWTCAGGAEQVFNFLFFNVKYEKLQNLCISALESKKLHNICTTTVCPGTSLKHSTMCPIST